MSTHFNLCDLCKSYSDPKQHIRSKVRGVFFNIIKTKSDLKKQKIYLKEYVTVPNYGRLKTTLLMLYLPEIVDIGTKNCGICTYRPHFKQ